MREESDNVIERWKESEREKEREITRDREMERERKSENHHHCYSHGLHPHGSSGRIFAQGPTILTLGVCV